MILLISGASHTGKTALAQRLMEKRNIPYLSIDHLKMGLIRSGYTDLTPCDDRELTEYLWPILREMIKTAIENDQNLILEGCYIPFDWARDFDSHYRMYIRAGWLILSQEYIRQHFDTIRSFANVIEQRLDDTGCTPETLTEDNLYTLEQCRKHNCNYCLIQDTYDPQTVEEHFLRLLREEK